MGEVSETSEQNLNHAPNENFSLAMLMVRSSELMNEVIFREGEISYSLEKTLQTLDIQRAQKVDSYHHILEQFHLQAEHFRKRSREFQKVAQRLEDAEARIKERLKELMIHFDKKEILGNDFRFRLTKSPEKLVLEAEDQIPSMYLKQVVEVDRELIKADLLEGKVVPGARLEQGQSLRAYPNIREKR